MRIPCFHQQFRPVLTLIAALVIGFMMLPPAEAAQRYQTGDIVENFTLTKRGGGTLSLQDFEGKVVFLEWFAWWCPYCQAAASMIGPQIVEYYATRNGNSNGVPVVHISLNLQAGQDSLTDGFIRNYRLGIVAEDTNRAVADRFQASGQPIFAIINGVANSPGHKQWELLLNQNGYGSTQAPITTFRNVIDSVKAAPVVLPPVITIHPKPLTLDRGQTASFSVTATSEAPLSYQWRHNGSPITGATNASLELPAVSIGQGGEYDVIISNTGGAVTSSPARLEVVLPPPTPARISNLAWREDGSFAFVITGEESRTYQVQISTNLEEWTSIDSISGSVTGKVFIDSGVSPNQRRFYRVISEF